MDWKLLEWQLNWKTSGRVRYGRNSPEKTPQRRTDLSDFDLWYYWAGRGRLRLRSGWIPVEPGVCVWARPGWTYETIQNDSAPLGLTYIHFNLLNAAGQPGQLSVSDLPPEQLTVENPAFVEATTRYIGDYCRALQISGRGLVKRLPAVTALLRALLLVLAEDSQAVACDGVQPIGQSVVQELLRRIRSDVQAPYTVEALARDSGYTRQHLNRLCRTATGMSLQQYIQASRIAYARQLLADPRLSIAQVADQCGYPDPLYFSRQFRKTAGVNPSAFRRQVIANGPSDVSE